MTPRGGPGKEISLAVVMPAFNEEEGIASFIRELDASLSHYRRRFIVVDDCSTDSMSRVLLSVRESGSISLEVVRNPTNQGHGPSTVSALSLGARSGSDLVLACDGDGQIMGTDARKLVDRLQESRAAVVEGVRVGRSDSLYRKIVTLATRLLVFSRCGSMPKDANSPFRAYRAEILASILMNDRIGGLVPNLHISAHVRNHEMRLLEIPVTSIPRRGSTTVGSTWVRKQSKWPSRRFLKFCTQAVVDWTRRSSR